MKLYNPILGGQRITINGRIYVQDQYIETKIIDKKSLLEEYPFLIDMDQKKYKPSFVEKVGGYNKQNNLKHLWRIIKINLFKLLLAMKTYMPR